MSLPSEAVVWTWSFARRQRSQVRSGRRNGLWLHCGTRSVDMACHQVVRAHHPPPRRLFAQWPGVPLAPPTGFPQEHPSGGDGAFPSCVGVLTSV